MSDRYSREAVDETVAYLASRATAASIAADPYWPKWDSPWWRMTLLWELGLARLIPPPVVEIMVDAIDTHYLRLFPVREEELPPGCDPHRQVLCHCAAGTMMQVLYACGVDLDVRLPWMRPWLHQYQLPDGGLNCDEAAYVKSLKSSMVSTLPPLEAALRCSRGPLSADDIRFLDRGAAYLIAHRLVRRAHGDSGVIDSAWLEPCFPRFYHYDSLRGLSFLAEWADTLGRALPDEAVSETVSRFRQERAELGGIQVRRRAAATASRTLARSAEGQWLAVDESRTFPLLDEVGLPGRVSPELTALFDEAEARILRVQRRSGMAG
jgi:hypothetical protein